MSVRKFKSLIPRALLLAAILIAGSGTGIAQVLRNRYILILDDPAVSDRYPSRESVESAAGSSYKQQIEAAQRKLKAELATRNIQVTGSVSTIMNAIFVNAPADRLDELKSLPGVKGVVAQRRYHLNLNRATLLLNAPAAWTAVGGSQNAGAGVKIAILDTGIDQNHPAFQDSALKPPPGYPICSGSDCAFTNNKVIVARSYVRQLAAGSDPNNPAVDSNPDDFSARDRSGHGSATASCAGSVPNTGPNGLTITGMAPKVFLGNYKIFGSSQVNDFTSDAVIVQALEDALNDHMDIASLSVGGPTFSGPLDSGAICGNPAGVPCDVAAQGVEKVSQMGMLVVVAAGNEAAGDDQLSAFSTPILSSIASPANAPSAIAAGASTNSHFLFEGVEVPGAGVPSNLQVITGAFGDGPYPNTAGAIAAPGRDITQLGNDGLACTSLPAGSLTGQFALIERGTCTFVAKVLNAQNAGAAGVIFYMSDQTRLIAPQGLGDTNIPAVMISNTDGTALKNFLNANAGRAVIMDPSAIEQPTAFANQLLGFSSLGPTVGDNALKPDLLAVGDSVYMAAESYDPIGDLYSANGYASASGTSFATPLTAGAAALVKQAHPNFTPAQIKSALVNTANATAVTRDGSGNLVGIPAIGAGLLDAGSAVQAAIAVSPASISFGALTSLPASKQIQVTNTGSSQATLSLAITTASPAAAGVTLTLDKQSLTLAPGASSAVTLMLAGSVPPAGAYSGSVTIQGAGSPLHVPYLFLVSTGFADNLFGVGGGLAAPGQDIGPIAVRLIDARGLPIAGAPVSFTATGGTLKNADTQTNAEGVAMAEAFLGSQPGNYTYVATAGVLTLRFTGTARRQPAIQANGVVNAASFDTSQAIAPGSYVTIFGTNLSDTSDPATTSILPLTIDGVTVSFDVPSAHISVPGHLVYVSPNQVNLQVPWELQGQTSVQVKVTVNGVFGIVTTVPLSDYSPAFFEIGGGNVAALDASFRVIGASNPAPQGQSIQLYANGFGPLNNQPASGDPAGTSPLSTCKGTATVTIGSKTAPVSFCGLAPGFPGLYQLNVTVPTGLTPGPNTIAAAIGGQTSKTSSIVVQ